MLEKTILANAARDLNEAKPDIAIGLGLSIGDGPAEVQCQGPLWFGSPKQVGPDARWHIGSITKSMTSTLVLQQVDQGKLDLDQPIGHYLQNINGMDDGWRALTLAQLLSHTAGIAPNPPLWQFLKWRHMDGSSGRRRILEKAWRRPPRYHHGRHRYSNLGYMLVGLILEEVMHLPWETITRQQIGESLGLASLGFGAPHRPNDPMGHSKPFFRLRPKERDKPGADNPAWLGPAGTVHMSIDDLLIYGRAQLKAMRGEMPDFLSEQSSIRMQTPVSQDYGLGWVIQDGTF